MVDYFFSGKEYIRVTRGDTGPGTVDPGYPAPISNWNWGAFGANGIDAALYSGSKCYFFSGKEYIRVTRGVTGPGTVDPGYPAPISNWNWGAFGANGIDAALNSGSKCYFFSGKEYIRVTRGETGPGTVDSGYPAPISNWNWGAFGANGIDAALYSGSKCYFFSGKEYIRVTRGETGPGTVDSGYPAPISNWNWGAFGTNGINAALYSGGPPVQYLTTIVVVAGSNNDNRFVVVDFSRPTTPGTVFVNPPFSGGCLVDCSGTLAAVGNYMGSLVAIYDITNPASPTLKGTFDSGLRTSAALTGIGALSLDGTNVLVGEYNGPTVVLMDVSKPPSSSIVSTYRALDFANGGISSIVLKGSYAVASGQYTFDVFDYTTPATPSVWPYVPDAANGNIRFQGPVTCDFDGSTAAFGDGSGNVYVFSIVGGAPIYTGQFSSGHQAVTSVAVMVNLVAAGFVGDGSVSLIDVEHQPSPSVSQTLVSTGPGPDPGGPLKFLGLPDLALGTNNGTGVIWLNTLNPLSPSPFLTASNAVLAPGLRATLGFTGWPFPP